jgi:light-regulated signal transduction histidine kinase (bacteriophytochrome)
MDADKRKPAQSDPQQRVARLEAELEAARRELEAFTHSVSHDLRAPLRAISGFSQILMEEHAAGLSAEAQRLLKVVDDSGKRMDAMVEALLRLSRLGRQPLTPRRIDMNALAREALGELREAQQGRALELRVDDALPECEGDAALLKRVLVELLANALKFTRGRAPARIEVSGGLEAGAPTYHVRDNGVGFDPRYAQKLFGVFQRMHSPKEFEGVGIGLAIVQRIVQRHGGSVRAAAEPERGATFSFSLPG